MDQQNPFAAVTTTITRVKVTDTIINITVTVITAIITITTIKFTVIVVTLVNCEGSSANLLILIIWLFVLIH